MVLIYNIATLQLKCRSSIRCSRRVLKKSGEAALFLRNRHSPSLFLWLKGRAGAAPPTPLPTHHSPLHSPQTSELTVALRGAAGCQTPSRWNELWREHPPRLPRQARDSENVGRRTWFPQQNKNKRLTSQRSPVLENTPTTYRTHLSINRGNETSTGARKPRERK